MEELVEQGLIKSIGLSNFSPQKIESFISDVKIRPAVNQVRFEPTAGAHMLITICSTCVVGWLASM